MVILGIVPVFHPLLKLAPRSDFRTHQPVPQPGKLFAVVLIHTQFHSGFNRVGEQVPDQLLVVGDAAGAREQQEIAADLFPGSFNHLGLVWYAKRLGMEAEEAAAQPPVEDDVVETIDW